MGLYPSVANCYTANPGAGDRVMMVPAAGGTPSLIDYLDNSAGNCGLYGMVFDSTSIYWANYSDGVIRKASLAGTNPTTVYTGPGYMNALALSGSNLYYHSYPNSSLSRVSTAGAGNTTFASTANSNGQNLAADGNALYWTDYNAGTVNKAPLNATALPVGPAIIASGETTPLAPYVTSSAIYWLKPGASGALRFSGLSAPSAAASLSTAPLASPGSVVVDANYAWVLASGSGGADGRIYRIPVGGGAPVVVAQGLYNPNSLVMDAAHLYWCNGNTTTNGTRNSDGSIQMLAK